jgi:hypothetical protein
VELLEKDALESGGRRLGSGSLGGGGEWGKAESESEAMNPFHVRWNLLGRNSGLSCNV